MPQSGDYIYIYSNIHIKEKRQREERERERENKKTEIMKDNVLSVVWFEICIN